MPGQTNLKEEVLEPALPIIDAHHHLWRDNHALADFALTYMAPELVADAEGHKLTATIYVEAHVGYRTEGPDVLRPVGETEFAVQSAGRLGEVDVCAGIVSFADLMIGESVGEVLDAHIEAGHGRFRGIRNSVTNVSDPSIPTNYSLAPPHRLSEPSFRAGARELVRRGLTFDTWLFQPQLDELADFADALPNLTIVLDHAGGYLGVGHFADRPEETFTAWRDGMAEVAKRPNVMLKIGGMGMPMVSPQLIALGRTASSEAMAAAWKPLFDTSIELFGVDRCMLESNFPVDSLSGSYRNFWNAFKRLTVAATPSEKKALFAGTAAKIYKLTGVSQ